MVVASCPSKRGGTANHAAEFPGKAHSHGTELLFLDGRLGSFIKQFCVELYSFPLALQHAPNAGSQGTQLEAES